MICGPHSKKNKSKARIPKAKTDQGCITCSLLWLTLAKTEIMYPRNLRAQGEWISNKMNKLNNWNPWQLKKSNSYEPFWSYELNSHFCQFGQIVSAV